LDGLLDRGEGGIVRHGWRSLGGETALGEGREVSGRGEGAGPPRRENQNMSPQAGGSIDAAERRSLPRATRLAAERLRHPLLARAAERTAVPRESDDEEEETPPQSGNRPPVADGNLAQRARTGRHEQPAVRPGDLLRVWHGQ